MTENKTDKLDKILDKLISRFEFRILPPVSPAYRKDKIEQAKSQILAEAERKALEVINKARNLYPYERSVTVMGPVIYRDDVIKGIKTTFGGKE